MIPDPRTFYTIQRFCADMWIDELRTHDWERVKDFFRQSCKQHPAAPWRIVKCTESVVETHVPLNNGSITLRA